MTREEWADRKRAEAFDVAIARLLDAGLTKEIEEGMDTEEAVRVALAQGRG
jgi:hypothetical protein